MCLVSCVRPMTCHYVMYAGSDRHSHSSNEWRHRNVTKVGRCSSCGGSLCIQQGECLYILFQLAHLQVFYFCQATVHVGYVHLVYQQLCVAQSAVNWCIMAHGDLLVMGNVCDLQGPLCRSSLSVTLCSTFTHGLWVGRSV